MMDRTDRHFRHLVRLLTRRALLYTEMVTTGSVIHGDRDRLLGFGVDEHPIALQLGGDDPADLARCARIGCDLGYDEINLNVGCPSDRVRRGSFGVCLMGQPARVAEAVAAMRAAVEVPVTVKHRIGYDDLDRYEDMARFVGIVAEAGCDRFIVHARKAWLDGVSPKANRTAPPLRYDDVYRLKQEHPALKIEINGGITTLEQVREHLAHVDGAMIGRAAYDDPYMLAGVDAAIYGVDASPPSRQDVAEAMLPYIDHWVSRGLKVQAITRHMLNLFAGLPGARAWRRELTTGAVAPGAGAEVVRRALAHVSDATP